MSHSKNHVTDNRLNRCFTIHQEGFSPIPTKEDGGGGKGGGERWWGSMNSDNWKGEGTNSCRDYNILNI